MTIRLTPDGPKMPIRFFLNNESGYHLDLSLYREVPNKKSGETIFESYHRGKQGPLQGKMLRQPYLTRDQLQQKRFSAQSGGTTYVYDLPEMFRQALIKEWETFEALKRRKCPQDATPSDGGFKFDLAACRAAHQRQG